MPIASRTTSSRNLGPWDEAMLSAELHDLPAEDYDLSLVGFSEGELDKPLAFVPEGENEDCAGSGGTVPTLIIPEPPHNPASRTGDLWVFRDHRLLRGDSTNPPPERCVSTTPTSRAWTPRPCGTCAGGCRSSSRTPMLHSTRDARWARSCPSPCVCTGWRGAARSGIARWRSWSASG